MHTQTCSNDFRVDWGGARVGFMEVSDLSIKIDVVQFNEVQWRGVTIDLLDATHNPMVTKRLVRAFPSKRECAPLNAQGSDLAIESLTLEHEGLRVRHAA